MPTYVIKNKETGEMFEGFMSWKEKEEFLEEHPEFVQVIQAASIVGGVDGLRKVDGGFNEVLQKVAESHPSSPLAEKLGGRNRQEVATAKIVEKFHKEAQGHITKGGKGGF